MQGRKQGQKRRGAVLAWLLAAVFLLAGAIAPPTQARAPARGPARDGFVAVQEMPREARATYELIAKRLPDREAEIMGRMADAEANHRQRLEAR